MIPNVRNGGVIVDAQEVITAVSSVGFPIVACIGLFYLYDRTIKEIISALSKVIDTLNNVNGTLTKIDDRLDDLGE